MGARPTLRAPFDGVLVLPRAARVLEFLCARGLAALARGGATAGGAS